MQGRTTRRKFLHYAGSGMALAALVNPSIAFSAELTLADIKKRGVLRIGCEASYPPITFRNTSGELAGYDVDLAAAFCKNLGVRPEFIDTIWAGVIPSLYTDKFDIIMSSMSYTAERMQKVAFSIPYVEASQAMLIRASDKNVITGTASLNGKVLGLKLGSPGQMIAPKIEAQLKSAGGSGFKEIKTFDDHPAAYLALAQGKVDAVLNTLPTLSLVIKQSPGTYAIVKGIGSDNWAGIATRLENKALIAYLDGQLRQFKKDGTLHALQQKWFGFDMNLPDAIPALG